jgi:hypothetical protein
VLAAANRTIDLYSIALFAALRIEIPIAGDHPRRYGIPISRLSPKGRGDGQGAGQHHGQSREGRHDLHDAPGTPGSRLNATGPHRCPHRHAGTPTWSR